MELSTKQVKTDIGIIPSDWEVRTLSDITEGARPISYGIVQTGDEVTNGVRCIRVVDIKDGHIDDSALITTSQEISDSYSRTILREGDAVIALRGKIGEVAVVPEHLEGANLTRGVALLAVVEPYSGRYVKHFLSSPIGKSILERKLNGSALQELPISSLRKVKIACPSLPEQRAIADALSDVDTLIEQLDALLAKKRAVKTATMQRLLTGKQRLPGFSEPWETRRLGEVTKIVNGGTPSSSVDVYWNGDIPWCTPTDITGTSGRYLSETERNITEKGLANSSASLLPEGTLLLCSRATVGEVKIAVTPITTNQGFKSLICGPDVSNEFLYYILLTMKSELEELSSGSTFLELSKRSAALLEITLPPIQEQKAIAQILSDMDAEIEALEARRGKTQRLKQGMMQELLTGRTRLV